ncbi:hypothetical protein M0765_012670 [Variovorax sp. S2]|uniref:hypothetical protein n=1 Tax=Variovorax sp. S12S4 TaxID=3029170 RepID=UPI00215C590B|nr:hypothetical protein [Variovorax sp. S12S4]MCR8958547.1 hypothetical protein [Variovorax sp. S12S4]
MQLIFGPSNSRYSFTGSPVPHKDLAYKLDVATLGQAIAAYEARFNVTITPFAGDPLDPYLAEPKYFKFKENDADAGCLVDIHVYRQGVEICLKQDLDFCLFEGDIIELGPLVC